MPNKLFIAAALPLVVIFLVGLWNTVNKSEPLTFMLPNLLLYTNLREETRELWRKYLKFDTAVTRYPTHIPTINAANYTYENLRLATENWRYPAIVRGLFSNTPAAEKWAVQGYLQSKIGEYEIPVIETGIVGTNQGDRIVKSFGEAYTELLGNDSSLLYLFFPVQSRFAAKGVDAGKKLKELSQKVNDIVVDDLEINKRIWEGFGTPAHSTFFGSQLIIGRGTEDTEQTTGTGWHCAAGNNWFVQVLGRKRWYFLDPKYSAYMHPLRGGRVNMMAGVPGMDELQKHLPVRYADLEAGDLLYNPDWEWHTIKNYAGLSIGVPIREVNVSLSFQNNKLYTSIVLINKVLEKFGLDIGGYINKEQLRK